jgi:hypothetical protein
VEGVERKGWAGGVGGEGRKGWGEGKGWGGGGKAGRKGRGEGWGKEGGGKGGSKWRAGGAGGVLGIEAEVAAVAAVVREEIAGDKVRGSQGVKGEQEGALNSYRCVVKTGEITWQWEG